MSRKSVNARIAATKATPTTQDAKSVLAAMVAASSAREAAEAAEARKAEEAARKAAMPQPKEMTPEEEQSAARKAAEFRANGGLKAIGRQHQERLAQERREAAEEARKEAFRASPKGRALQAAQEAKREAVRGATPPRPVRLSKGEQAALAWEDRARLRALEKAREAEALEDLFATITAGERAEKRLLELGSLPSSLLAQKGEEVKGCLQAKEAATRAEEELAKLGH